MSEGAANFGDDEFAWGRKLHQSGLIEDAIACYRNVLLENPDNPALRHHLGTALLADGSAAEAVQELREATRLAPDDPDIWNDLAVAADAAGHLSDAESAFRRCLDLSANLPDVRLGLAHVLWRQDRTDEAAAILDTLAGTGQRDALVLLARIWLQRIDSVTEPEAALDASRKAVDVAIDSRDAELIAAAHNARFDASGRSGDIEAQRQIVEQLCLLQPDSAAAHLLRGRAALLFGHDAREAAAAFDRALAIDSESLEAQWFRCFLSVRHGHGDAEDIARSREDYARRLGDLRERIRFADKDTLARAEALLGTIGPAFLPYQGENDRDLQALFGEMAAEIMRARYPAPPPSPENDGRIRIAFVSDVIYSHSNWKLRRGWLRHLGGTRFHVSAYHLGERTDWLTDEIRGYCDAFHHIPGDFETALGQLRRDAPHIIVYPNIGLSASVAKLAALRIAPVQCTTWGHPVTSGLPTIDDFLSSDLMEPPGGEEHYTERLVRLPGLSITYDPVPAGDIALDRADFGLADNGVVYLAVQSLQKYLPQFDDAFPRIGATVPSARFVFIEDASEKTNQLFRLRLASAFRRHGLDPDAHLRFLPKQPFDRFQQLLRNGDVFLDSMEWSGCNTTLEALRWDLPVVTAPGRFMRGRHSSAILEFIGLGGHVATDLDAYVAQASALGIDPEKRAAMRREIAAAKTKLSQDLSAVEGLMDYFTEAAAETAARPPSDASARRSLEKAADGLYRRQYASYDAYVAHQRDKLRHLDLAAYDADFENELRTRLDTAGLVTRGDTVLCLGARLGSECRAFIGLGAFAVGIDLNPGTGNHHVVVGDFHDPQFADASVDIVYTNCLDHSFDLEKVMASVDRVLNPGGAFIADIMNGAADDEAWTADGYDCLFWDKAEDFIETLRQITGFTVESATPMRSVWGWPGRMAVFRKR